MEKKRIVEIGKGLSASKGLSVIDVSEKIVVPGLVDMHVHLREPGREDEETIKSGAAAAAKGGFTAIICMANTKPPVDNATVVDMIRDKAADESVVKVWPVGAITKGLKGQELAEMADMHEAGAIGFSDDGRSVMDSEVMRRVLEYSKMLKVPVIIHAEDSNLAGQGQINEGYYSTLLGMKGIPGASEEVIIARDLRLAELAKAKIHVTHISTKKSVELIRQAKKSGVKVSCDVTPHHLVLSDADLVSYDTNLKVKPPLRKREDIEALKEGLEDDTIDAIASDHAPHAPQEKECEFEYAAFGMIGLETSLSLMMTYLVNEGMLSIEKLVTKMSCNPAMLLGLDKQGCGTLRVDTSADITVLDDKAKVKVEVNKMVSKSKNSPFDGYKLVGRSVMTMVDGRIVDEDIQERERARV